MVIWLSGALFKINIFIPPNDSFIGSKITDNFKVSDCRGGIIQTDLNYCSAVVPILNPYLD